MIPPAVSTRSTPLVGEPLVAHEPHEAARAVAALLDLAAVGVEDPVAESRLGRIVGASTTSTWSQPTPKRRSARRRARRGARSTRWRMPSSTTKSLPRPCILVNAELLIARNRTPLPDRMLDSAPLAPASDRARRVQSLFGRQPRPAPRMPSPRTFRAPDPADYARRLAIVVPYRDRAEHLARFLPHMVTYFERDKLDRRSIIRSTSSSSLAAAVQPRRAAQRRLQDRSRQCRLFLLPRRRLSADLGRLLVRVASDPARLARPRSADRLPRVLRRGRRIQSRRFRARSTAYSNDYWAGATRMATCATAAVRRPRAGISRRDALDACASAPRLHDDATPTTEAQATARTFAAKLLEGASGFGARAVDARHRRPGYGRLGRATARPKCTFTTTRSRCADIGCRDRGARPGGAVRR